MVSKIIATLITASVLISCEKNNSGNIDSNPVDSLKIGLLAHYSFDGNANDESGNNYHLNVNGATLVQDRFGSDSKAYFFSGADYMTIPKLLKADGKTGSTISLWIKPENLLQKNALLHFVSNRPELSCSSTFMLFKIPSGFNLQSGYLAEQTPTSCSVSINGNRIPDPTAAWQHLVFVQRPLQSTIYYFQHYHYLNGKALINQSASGFNPISTSFIYGGRVGAEELNNSTFNHFQGSIDDIRIYDRALSENEIQKLFTMK